jgi:hypothetical protein
MIARAQTSLPGRKGRSKHQGGVRGAVMEVFSSLGGNKTSARSRKPSKKGMAGIVAGAGLGAAAMAKRRRPGHQDTEPISAPLQPIGSEGSTPAA